jgi:hypothetical protein
MTLDEQIAQITDPLEFTRLCNTILTEKYGKDFQIIDGTRGDEGNDGYVISEKRIIAIFCPIKPERRTDSDYVKKICSDLKKAQILRDSSRYKVENWTFITPRKLCNGIIVKMRNEANSLGLNATHLESTYLANELYRNKHLIEAFPFLHILDVYSRVNEIISLLKNPNYAKENVGSEFDKDRIYRGKAKDKDELKRVFNIRTKEDTDSTKSDLKTIYYTTTDKVVKINALIGFLEFYDPIEDSADDFVALCNEGVTIAHQLGISSVKAYFMAKKGYILSWTYCDLDMKTAGQIMIGNEIGFHTISEVDRQEVIKKLTELEKEFNQLFAEALNLCKANNDFVTLASVLIFIGNAAGQRSFYLHVLGVSERAVSEKIICRQALLAAKEIFRHLNDELGVANALLNLANQIRFLGEKAEAMSLAKNVIIVSRKFGDRRLLQRAQSLLDSLKMNNS